MMIKDKKRFAICSSIIIIILLILIVLLIHVLKQEVSIDLTNSLHGIICEDAVELLYDKNKSLTLSKGDLVHIIQDNILEKSYTISFKGRTGNISKDFISIYEYQPHEKYSLMVDVSEFNMRDNFQTSGDFALFVINHGINYVYMRLGGRGYGEKGNLYYDSAVVDYIEVCDFLNIPYGFYYLDEALNEEEVKEEVQFVKKFLNEHSANMNVLPLAIDLEFQEGAGRADKIWNERITLLTMLINEFDKEDISCILYANAKRANDYLATLDTNFWIARYPQNGIVPNSTFKEFITIEQNNAILNSLLDKNHKLKSNIDKNKEFNQSYSEDFINKIIGWQFTADGAIKDGIHESIDLSIVKNSFFQSFLP